ncbi:MAG: dTDP-4-dehydrorhamnose 3,5-epimerase [Desulfobacca sp.]|uniref:dTDP-4-dehydrorhamnose 3,5-epimerase n=1 Tax=Desulfobacca sp. TaxID=2067990 RepID=UPI00404AB11D
MKILPGTLPGLVLLEPRLFPDQRGYFLETYQARRYAELGLTMPFVQDNLSVSRQGVVRGLHYQLRHPQGKLVMALHGDILDAVVDIRPDSPTFRQWSLNTLSASNHRQLYVPPGYAHGFLVLSDTAIVLYKVTDFYQPGDEYGVLWNDPDLAIPWPQTEAILSDKDAALPRLQEIPLTLLPKSATSP